MNTTATTDLAALLASPLTESEFKTDAVTIYTDTPNPQTMGDYRLDLGGLYFATIHGCNAALPYGGHPMPTIEQAEAIRAEIIRRWNAFPALEQDKARLDWMESARVGVESDMVDDHHGETTREVWYAQGQFPQGVRISAREAIDAAMQAEASK